MDKQYIAENPTNSSALTPILVSWSAFLLVLAFIIRAIVVNRQLAVRVTSVGFMLLLLSVTVLTTVRLNSLSGYIGDNYAAEQARIAVRDNIAAKSFTACEGNPVADTSPMSWSDIPVGKWPTAVAFDAKGRLLAWDMLKERGWAPNILGDLQVVLCVGEEKEIVGYCNYTGGHSYKNIYYTTSVRAVKAMDGTVLTDSELSGSDPSSCAPQIVNGQHGDVQGGHVGDTELINYIAENLQRS